MDGVSAVSHDNAVQAADNIDTSDPTAATAPQTTTSAISTSNSRDITKAPVACYSTDSTAATTSQATASASFTIDPWYHAETANDFDPSAPTAAIDTQTPTAATASQLPPGLMPWP